MATGKTTLVSRLCALASSILCLSVSFSGFCADAVTELDEDQLKATFIYSFTKFTYWPGQNDTNIDDRQIYTCVLGAHPFGRELDQIAETQARFSVQYLRAGDSFSHCHVLFVSRSENTRLQEILLAAQDLPILTISDMDNFVESGGIIGLALTRESTIRPVINLSACRRSNLRLSSKLLRLATVIDSQDSEP